MLLDIRTLVAVLAGVSFLMGFLMTYLLKISKQIHGPGYWALGSFSIGIGCLIYALYPLLGKYMLFVISGAFALAGITLFWAGIRSFGAKNISLWILLGFPLLQLVQGTIFFYIFPLPQVRMFLYSLLNLTIALLAYREMLNLPDAHYKLPYRVNASAFLFFSLIMAVRAIFAFISELIDPYHPHITNVLMFLANSFTIMLLAYGFILIVAQKLSFDLREEVKTRNKFFNIISHDLIGPVGTMVEFIALIKEDDEDVSDEDRKSFFNELDKLSESTFHLLHNLLDWSRAQSGTLSPNKEHLLLGDIVGEAIIMVESQSVSKHIKIESEIEKNVNVEVDRKMVETVVRNLISNAIKFTPFDGLIKVSVHQNGEGAVLSIHDNGVGISKEKLHSIFNVGEIRSERGTAGEKGSGLGLIICKEFVEMNNGKIQIVSKEGEGTNMIIKFASDKSI